VRRGYLGVTTSAAGSGREAGARVVESVERGPAARAGLRRDDVILAVAGQRVRGPGDLAAVVVERRPGQRVDVEYRRDGETRSADVELGRRPS
jgi:S1-C subfamily serine protease